MKYRYKGKEISERDLYNIIYKQLTDDVFEDYLNKTWPLIDVMGVTYGMGTLLMKTDYERFRAFRIDDCESLSREVTTDEELANDYGIEWAKEEEDE